MIKISNTFFFSKINANKIQHGKQSFNILHLCCIVNLYLERSYILESLTCKLHQYKLAIGLELNQSVPNQADQKLNVKSTSLHIYHFAWDFF